MKSKATKMIEEKIPEFENESDSNQSFDRRKQNVFVSPPTDGHPSEQMESLSSSEEETESARQRNEFYSNNQIRQTLIELHKQGIGKKEVKDRQISELNRNFERKSILNNKRGSIHAKAISRVFKGDRSNLFEIYSKIIMFLVISHSFLVLCNLTLIILENEKYQKAFTELLNTVPVGSSIQTVKTKLDSRSLSTPENLYRSFSALISVLLVCVVGFKYKYMLSRQKLTYDVDSAEIIWNTPLWKPFLAEILLSAVCFPPGLSYNIFWQIKDKLYFYSVFSLGTILSFIKLYSFLVLFLHFTVWNSRVAQNVSANFEADHSLTFVLKSRIRKRSFRTIITILFSIVFLYSYILKIAEFGVIQIENNKYLKIHADLNDFYICTYLIFNTITSVGYGDFYPVSVFGRIICVTAAITGIFLMGVIVVTITDKVEFKDEEKKAFMKLKQKQAFEKVEEKASQVILSVLQFRSVAKKKPSEAELGTRLATVFVCLTKLRTNINYFVKDKSNSKSIHMPIDEMFENIDSKVTNNLSAMGTNIHTLDLFTQSLKGQFKQNFDNYLRLKGIFYYQNKIATKILQKANQVRE